MKNYYKLFILFSFLSLNVFAWKGEGTKSNPYKISSAEDLLELSNTSGYSGNHEGVYFEQTADINMSGVSDFQAIGFRYNPFKGNYDGKGYSIKNLIVKKGGLENSSIALFGATEGSTIENVKIRGISIFEGYNQVAAIVGYAVNSVIRNCSSSATVNGNSAYSNCIGGIVGEANKSTIEICYNTDVVSATGNNAKNIGGVVGEFTGSGELRACYNQGMVKGASYTGGVCGNVASYELIYYCYNRGMVTGTREYTGGVFGYIPTGLLSTGQVSTCYNSGKVKGNDYVGGIAGRTAYTVHSCNTGSVEGTGNHVGGIAGRGSIYKCYNKGNISGKTAVGGLAGTSDEMYDCYNRGDVTGDRRIGGIAGQMAGTANEMHNSYSTGKILSTNYTDSIGGIAGYVNLGGFINNNKIRNCYWNVGSYAGYAVGTWSETVSDTERFWYEPKTSGELKAYFYLILGEDWSHDTKNMNDGYPVLTGDINTLQPEIIDFFTIVTSVGSNGTVTNAGSIETVMGSSVLYIITPDEGYEIAQVLVDGEDKGKSNYLLLEDISSNHTISVTFKEEGSSGLPGILNNISCHTLAGGWLEITNAESTVIRIYDISGKEYSATKLNSNNEIINIEMLLKGIYIVNVETTEGFKTFKIIKD